MEDIHPGVVIEDYEFLAEIGKGTFANVWRVRSQKYNQIFVAKVAIIANQNVDRAWRCFDTEIGALLRLNHPNIIRLYGHFRYGDNFILILEYCANGTLEEYIEKNGPMKGRVLKQAVNGICSALSYAWSKGVQHRDIKPGNIMFDEGWRVKLVDFGISLARDADEVDNVVDFKCSPICAAPEILTRIPHDPVKSDIWAVGATILWMAKGQIPWYSKSRADLLRILQYGEYQIPTTMGSRVTKMVRRMLVLNPQMREFPKDEDIAALVASETTVTSKTEPRTRLDPLPCKSFRVIPLLGIGANSSRQLVRPRIGVAVSLKRIAYSNRSPDQDEDGELFENMGRPPKMPNKSRRPVAMTFHETDE